MVEPPGLRNQRRGRAFAFSALVLAMAVFASVARGLPLDLYGWIPFAAAALLLVSTQRPLTRRTWQGLGIGRLGLRAWPAALALPALALTAGYLVAAAIGAARLSLGGRSPVEFLAFTVVVIVVASLEAIGEEIGWRGFLLPLLAGRGRVVAGLSSGLLWTAWHVPLIYIAAAYHPGARVPYLLAFGVTITAISFIANELRMAGDSVWPAVVFHGAHNGIWFVLQALVAASSADLDRVGGESGIVPLAIYSALALWIVLRRPPWSRAKAD